MSQRRHLPPHQYFQGKVLANQPWRMYRFKVRPTDRTVKLKPRSVQVLCKIPMAAELGIGAYEDETVVVHELPQVEQWFQGIFTPRRVKDSEQIDFFFSLTNNLRSGVPLLEALSRGISSSNNPYFRGVVASVIFYLKTIDGSFSRAISFFPEAFDEVTVSIIFASETAGDLVGGLDRVFKMKRDNLKLSKRASSVMAYPITVIVLAFLLVNVMGVFILPRLEPVFKTMLPLGLPTSTKIVFGASQFMRDLLPYSPIFIISGIYAWRYRRALTDQRWYQRGILKIPGLGKLIFYFVLIRTLRVFSQLLRAGVPPQRIYDTAGRVSGNVVFADYFRAIYARLRGGRDPHPAFFAERHRLGEAGADLAQSMRIGQSTGHPSDAIDQRLEIYESELNSRLEKLPTYINMVMMVAIAPLLVLLALAIIEPSLKMGQDSLTQAQKKKTTKSAPAKPGAPTPGQK